MNFCVIFVQLFDDKPPILIVIIYPVITYREVVRDNLKEEMLSNVYIAIAFKYILLLNNTYAHLFVER